MSLIDPVYAEIYQLDTQATEDYDPPGPVVSGYDPIFRTVTLVDENKDGVFESSRQESGPILVLCQVEYGNFEKMNMTEGGDDPESLIKLVFDACNLRNNGMIDAYGKPTIHKNDRVTRILKCDKTTLLQSFEDPRTDCKGFYIKELITSFGFEGLELVIATLEERKQSR